MVIATVADDVADAREQQLQMFVDLGGGADGCSARAAHGLAGDGNRRGDALDAFCLGLVELLQKLTGVGRKTLDVAALTLGVQRVECQARLAAAADAAEGDQPMVRQIQVDILQIVDRHTAEANRLRGCRAVPIWGRRHGCTLWRDSQAAGKLLILQDTAPGVPADTTARGDQWQETACGCYDGWIGGACMVVR